MYDRISKSSWTCFSKFKLLLRVKGHFKSCPVINFINTFLSTIDSTMVYVAEDGNLYSYDVISGMRTKIYENSSFVSSFINVVETDIVA